MRRNAFSVSSTRPRPSSSKRAAPTLPCRRWWTAPASRCAAFYLQFDGKHELLLALFEDALSRSADQIRAATESHTDPLERLQVAVQLLYEASRPDPTAKRPLFTDFAPRLLVTHPAEVKVAHAPLLALLTELMEAAGEAGKLRATINPKRVAAMTMQTVMFIAQSSGGPDDATTHPITAEEVWDFCSRGFVA